MISPDLFATLRPGDKVKIVDRWPADGRAGQAISGAMNRYLGKIMTIHSRHGMCAGEPAVRMAEDSAWVWNLHGIAAVLRDSSLDLEEFI